MEQPTLKQESGLWVLRHESGVILWKEKDETRVKGVTYDKRTGKFMAQIRENGKNKNLGYFDTQEQAARKYQTYARYIEALNTPNREEI